MCGVVHLDSYSSPIDSKFNAGTNWKQHSSFSEIYYSSYNAFAFLNTYFWPSFHAILFVSLEIGQCDFLFLLWLQSDAQRDEVKIIKQMAESNQCSQIKGHTIRTEAREVQKTTHCFGSKIFKLSSIYKWSPEMRTMDVFGSYDIFVEQWTMIFLIYSHLKIKKKCFVNYKLWLKHYYFLMMLIQFMNNCDTAYVLITS